MQNKPLPVLAVEDDDTVLKIYRSVLGKSYDLIVAQSAAKGLYLFREHSEIPVVITAIAMESPDAGIDLINQVEALNPATQFIIISGLHGRNSVALQTARGKVASLPKPVEIMYLKMALEAAYARYFDYRLLYGMLDLITAHPNRERLMSV
ncbi:MAG: response regulator [Desulfobacterales bacterium]|nr:response regulator [Desulfobacterales bacterium]